MFVARDSPLGDAPCLSPPRPPGFDPAIYSTVPAFNKRGCLIALTVSFTVSTTGCRRHVSSSVFFRQSLSNSTLGLLVDLLCRAVVLPLRRPSRAGMGRLLHSSCLGAQVPETTGSLARLLTFLIDMHNRVFRISLYLYVVSLATPTTYVDKLFATLKCSP